MSNSSSKGTALITGASRGIEAAYAHVEALDCDFNLSKLENRAFRPDRSIDAIAQIAQQFRFDHDRNGLPTFS